MTLGLPAAGVLAEGSYRLSAGGWIIMILSVGFVTGLMIWCVRRVLTESTTQKLHSQTEIEPPDQANPEQ